MASMDELKKAAGVRAANMPCRLYTAPSAIREVASSAVMVPMAVAASLVKYIFFRSVSVTCVCPSADDATRQPSEKVTLSCSTLTVLTVPSLVSMARYL